MFDVGVALYSGVIDKVVPVSSTKAAEMTKLLENIHRAVNIGLVNELKVVADKMDIDIHEVIEAAQQNHLDLFLTNQVLELVVTVFLLIHFI